LLLPSCCQQRCSTSTAPTMPLTPHRLLVMPPVVVYFTTCLFIFPSQCGCVVRSHSCCHAVAPQLFGAVDYVSPCRQWGGSYDNDLARQYQQLTGSCVILVGSTWFLFLYAILHVLLLLMILFIIDPSSDNQHRLLSSLAIKRLRPSVQRGTFLYHPFILIRTTECFELDDQFSTMNNNAA